MVETITPVVHGGRRGRWAMTAALHVIGAGLSAAALGGFLGAAGLLLGAPWGQAGMVAIGAIAALYAGRELFGLPIPVPDRRGQVPEWWRSSLPPGPASFLYGTVLGMGFLTHLRHGTLVAVGAMALVFADPVVGAAVVAPFGLVRGLSVVGAAASAAPDRGTRVIARLESIGASAFPRTANGAVLVALTAATWPAAGGGSIGGLCAALVALMFASAGVAKVRRFARWRRSLAAYRSPAGSSVAVAVAVPIAELTVPILVATGRTAAGSTVALILLAAFSVAILRARLTAGDRLPCGCFGGHERRDYRLLLGRNLGLAGLAAAGMAGPAPVFPALRLPAPSELLPAVLVAAGLLCVVWTGRGLMAIRDPSQP